MRSLPRSYLTLVRLAAVGSSTRRMLRVCMALLAMIAILPMVARAQQAASGYIVLRVTVLPKLQIIGISPARVLLEDSTSRETASVIEIEGNLAYRVSVRRASYARAAGGDDVRIFVRNAQGRFEALQDGASVTVADAGHGHNRHEVECRVESHGAPLAETERCDLTYDVEGGLGETLMRLSANVAPGAE